MKKLLLLLLLPGMLWYSTAYAQEITVTLNENVLGEVTLTSPGPVYRFSAQYEYPLIVQVSSLSDNFAPIIVLYDAQGRMIQRAPNPTGLIQRQLIFTPQENTDYLIQILGVDGGQGEFVLTITEQPFTTAPPFIELRENYDFDDRVTMNDPIKTYQMQASQTAILRLEITTAGSAVVLSREDGTISGTASQYVPGSVFLIPPGLNDIYYVTIFHSGIDRREPFTVRLTPVETAMQFTPTATAQTPSPIPATTDSASCVAANNGTLPVNIRRGPGEDYGVMGVLSGGEKAPVTGRSTDRQWWQIEYPTGIYGWVSVSVIAPEGDCSDVRTAR